MSLGENGGNDDGDGGGGGYEPDGENGENDAR